MNTLSLDLASSDTRSGPACVKCRGRTRLIGIEPHSTQPHTDLRTYQCLHCDAVQAVEVPLLN